jgi:hypothetical protein
MPTDFGPSEQDHLPHEGQENLWGLGEPLPMVAPYPAEDSVPLGESQEGQGPAPADTYGDRYKTGTKRFAGDSGKAVPVFQRAATDANFGAISVGLTSGGTALVVNRQKGRVSVTLSVPLTYTNAAGVVSSPNGVVIATLEGEAQTAGSCFQLNPGDSITVATESPIWAGLIPGNTTGVVQWFVEYNPAAGELGNT